MALPDVVNCEWTAATELPPSPDDETQELEDKLLDVANQLTKAGAAVTSDTVNVDSHSLALTLYFCIQSGSPALCKASTNLVSSIFSPWTQADSPRAPPVALINLSIKLVRMQVLQCQSRQLSHTSRAVLAVLVADEPSTVLADPSADVLGHVSAAVCRLKFTSALVDHLVTLGINSYTNSSGTPGHTRAVCMEDRLRAKKRRAFVRELAAALHDSFIAEHHARLTLLILQLLVPEIFPAEQVDAVRELAAQHHNQAGSLRCQLALRTQLASLCQQHDGLTQTSELLIASSIGPCVRHLALVQAVAALCAADGGPDYGMPRALRQAMVLTHIDTDPHAVPLLAQDPLAHALDAVVDAHSSAAATAGGSLAAGGSGANAQGAASAAATPPGPQAALALAMRIGRLAVASGQHWAQAAGEPQAAAAAEQRPPSPRPTPAALLSRCGAGSLGAGAMKAARLLLPTLAAGAPFAQRGSVRAAGAAAGARSPASAGGELRGMRKAARAGWVERWRLAAEVYEHAAQWAPPEVLRQFAQELIPSKEGWPTLSGNGTLPPTPPLAVTCALSGGLLALYERLWRRAAASPSETEAAIIPALCAIPRATSWHVMGTLLAYGEPRQVASMLLTLRKLARHVPLAIDARTSAAVRAISRRGDGGGDGGGASGPPAPKRPEPLDTSVMLLLYGLLEDILKWAHGNAAAEAAEAAASVVKAGRAGAAPALPPAQRMALMAASMARGVLPAVAQLMMQSTTTFRLSVVLGRNADATTGAQACADSFPPVRMMLPWLPLVSALCLSADDSAVPRGTAMAAAGEAAAAAPTEQRPTDGLGAAADPAPASAAAVQLEGWDGFARTLLVKELGAVGFLGNILCSLPHLRGQELGEHLRLLARACAAVAAAAPSEVRQAVLEAAEAMPPAAGGRASGAPGHRALRAGAAAAAAGSRRGGSAASGRQAVAAAELPAWHPGQLRALRSSLQLQGDAGAEVAMLDVLVAVLEQLQAGGDARAGLAALRQLAVDEECRRVAGALVLLGADAGAQEACWGVRACGNPACTNLAGDSEAELPLKACSGCGVVGYCCRECQTAHWRAGHKAACSSMRAKQAGA